MYRSLQQKQSVNCRQQVALRLKRNTLYSVAIVSLWTILGGAYLHYLVIPHLRGENNLYVYGGDSFTYRNIAHRVIGNELLEGLKSGYTVNKFNLLGMALWAKLAELISYDYFNYVIVCLNMILLMMAIRNYRIIFNFYKSREYPKFIFFMALNPYIIACLCNVSKEVWGLLLVSYFLRYALYNNTVKYIIVTIVSFFIRDVYAVIGTLFFIISRFRISKIYYLVFVSLIVPYIVPEAQVRFLVQGQDEKSLGISVLLNNIQSYPFGYTIAYVPKLLMSAFADISPLRIIKTSNNIIGNFTTVSSALTFMLFLWICFRTFFRGIRANPMLLNFIYSYTLGVAITAFIHHRYLFPLYPVLVMTALIDREIPHFGDGRRLKRYIDPVDADACGAMKK